jgi:hypothetical protein
VTWGRIRGSGALLALAVFAALSLAATAGANLRPGSTNVFLVGKHHELALPVPLPLNVPNLTRDRHGLGHVAMCVRYQAANWSTARGVARDRALVTAIVSRRTMSTGPDPANPLYRHTLVDMAGLNRQHIVRCYHLQLPRSVSNFLSSKGAFVRSSSRRRSARHLLWIDVEQDRDFKKVDGRYDWREGTAVGAGDLAPPRPSLTAHAASTSSNPSGTLSITNGTAAGVYQNCTNCVGKTSGLPPTISGTLNSSTYAIPLAVAGDAVACFDSGTNGSNPTGFANLNPSGQPTPYSAGTVSAPSSGSSFPVTSGTTVTETLAGDDTLTPAPNTQTADTSGYIGSTVKLGLQAAKSVFSYPSPGAVVTGVLGVIVYFLENSCDDYGNFFNVTSGETNGGLTSTTIDAPQTMGFGIAAPTGSTPGGLQVGPSSLAVPTGSPSGSSLWLNNDIVVASPFADAGCNCSSYQGNSAIYTNWQTTNPCSSTYGAAECSLSPPQSPPVNYSGTNCGKSNASCAFPAANWPAAADAPRSLVYAALSGGTTGVLWGCDPFYYFNCYTGYQDPNSGTINALAYNGSNTIYMGDNDANFITCSSETGDCGSTNIEGKSQITALAYTGSGVLTAVYDENGINEGELWNCNVSSGTCNQVTPSPFGNGISITSMVSFNGSVFAAGNNGTIYVCSNSGSCSKGFTFSGKSISVDSITSAYGQLWAGLSNGQLWTCNPTATSCSLWDTIANGPAVTSLVAGPNNTVYLGAPTTSNGYGIWQCSTGGSNSCTGVQDTTTVTSLLYANGYLYYGTNAGAGVYKCNPSSPYGCSQLDNSAGTNEALNTKQYIPAMLAAPVPTG